MENVNGLTFYEDAQAIGSLSYHRVTLGGLLFVTDGVLIMCEQLKCFWVADIVASHLKSLARMDSFFAVYVLVNEKKECKFYFDDGNGTIKLSQQIPYTDLKLNLKLFLQKIDGAANWVLMLPSEY